MDSKLMKSCAELAKKLFTWSGLEKGRVRETAFDPREIGDFNALNDVVAQSLRAPGYRAAAPASSSGLHASDPKAALGDQSLLKKLILYRDRLPVSSRIIRSKQDPS